MLNRRDLLTAIAAGGTVLALPRLGWADETAAAAPARTVVLLHLNGGNDGLNTVVPYKQRRYFSLRPSVGVDRGRGPTDQCAGDRHRGRRRRSEPNNSPESCATALRGHHCPPLSAHGPAHRFG